MTTAQLEIINDSGVVVLRDNRSTVALLGKGGTAPAGTLFTATGASGATYHFGPPQGASSYGLTLFDASGAVLFDAASYGKMARPVGVMTGDIATTETQTKTQTFAAGRTYAVWITSSVSALRVRNVKINIGGAISYQYALDDQGMTVDVSGTTVTITATRTTNTTSNGSSSVPYDEAAKYDWRAIVLDVTDY